MAKTTGDTCTFCGRGSRDVNLLINGISGCICDDCVRQAYEIVKEQAGAKKTSFGLKQRFAEARRYQDFLGSVRDRTR